MKRQIDHTFNYRNLDNTKPYKDGMTRQQYYLYNFGSNWKEESEWSINDDAHLPKDFNGEIIIRTIKEPIELFYDYNDIKNQSFNLEYNEVKYEKWIINIDYKTLDGFRFKHPIPDIFKHDVAGGLIMCRMEELENPLTSLLREGMLKYYKFDMKMPIKLNYIDCRGKYIASGWRRMSENN